MTMVRDLLALSSWPMEAVKVGSDFVETMTAARRVVAARLPIISTAMTDPVNADHSELRRMVSEKVEALRTSGRSVEAAAETARRAVSSNAKAFGTLANGGLLWPADWMRMFEVNLAAAVALATLPAAALAPIHRGVIGNDKRLRGSKSAGTRSTGPTQPTGR